MLYDENTMEQGRRMYPAVCFLFVFVRMRRFIKWRRNQGDCLYVNYPRHDTIDENGAFAEESRVADEMTEGIETFPSNID